MLYSSSCDCSQVSSTSFLVNVSRAAALSTRTVLMWVVILITHLLQGRLQLLVFGLGDHSRIAGQFSVDTGKGICHLLAGGYAVAASEFSGKVLAVFIAYFQGNFQHVFSGHCFHHKRTDSGVSWLLSPAEQYDNGPCVPRYIFWPD